MPRGNTPIGIRPKPAGHEPPEAPYRTIGGEVMSDAEKIADVEEIAREIVSQSKLEPTTWSGDIRIETLIGRTVERLIAKAINEAVDAALERAAKVCDDAAMHQNVLGTTNWQPSNMLITQAAENALVETAAAIRTLKSNPETV
jgi:hypothetical protein